MGAYLFRDIYTLSFICTLNISIVWGSSYSGTLYTCTLEYTYSLGCISVWGPFIICLFLTLGFTCCSLECTILWVHLYFGVALILQFICTLGVYLYFRVYMSFGIHLTSGFICTLGYPFGVHLYSRVHCTLGYTKLIIMRNGRDSGRITKG